MLKCPNHGFPKEIIITNFYARLSGHYKDFLDASSEGYFTSKKIEVKWDLLERIQHNTENWEIDKGEESGINYEYDALSPLLKQIFLISLVLSLDLILKFVLIFTELLLLILIFLKKSGTNIMNLSKMFA